MLLQFIIYFKHYIFIIDQTMNKIFYISLVNICQFKRKENFHLRIVDNKTLFNQRVFYCKIFKKQ